MPEDKTSSPLKKLLQTFAYLLIVALVVGLLIHLSLHPEPRPSIPDNEQHQLPMEWKKCLDCHGSDGPNRLSPEHPINDEQCFRCHTPAAGPEKGKTP